MTWVCYMNHSVLLTLNLLTTTIVAPPSNASKWQMGFNSTFKGLNGLPCEILIYVYCYENVYRTLAQQTDMPP